MSACEARSSAFSIGVIIRSTVRNAAKLAVYEEIMMSVKNHHIAPTIRVDVAWNKMDENRVVSPCFVL